MHDPQDNGFTLHSFELSTGIKGTVPKPTFLVLPWWDVAYNCYDCYQVTAPRKGENNVL